MGEESGADGQNAVAAALSRLTFLPLPMVVSYVL